MDKAWLWKLVAANRFISGESQNEDVQIKFALITMHYSDYFLAKSKKINKNEIYI